MTYLTTFIGGFFIGFFLLWFWPIFVNRWAGKGGILAAVLLIGIGWLVNHGSPFPLIYQSGPVFIDMGLAVGTASTVNGLLSGASVRKTVPLVCSAILGGVLAGTILSFL